MDLFRKAKTVRLRSHHDKYLFADEDEESVLQERNGASRQARWTVELIDGELNWIRLKSCYNKYLTASNKPFMLGLTGHKVIQVVPRRLDSSVEWEPVREGVQVKLRTRYGHYLRGNGGVYPWRNSITHDVPQRTATQDWVLWDVDVVEIRLSSPEGSQSATTATPPRHSSPTRTATPSASMKLPSKLSKNESQSSISDSRPPLRPGYESKLSMNESQSSKYDSPEYASRAPVRPAYESKLSKNESQSSTSDSSPRYPDSPPRPSLPDSPPKHDGRMIQYYIADDDGNVDDSYEGLSFLFKGSSVQELTKRLQEEIGMDDVIVCTHSPLNGKLYPLRLHLPPNNLMLTVIVVQPSSKVAKSFESHF